MSANPKFIGPTISEECWIARRLGDPMLFGGTTTPEIRRERCRARILKLGIAQTAVGRRGGREESWRQFFERLYGVPLVIEIEDQPDSFLQPASLPECSR